MILKLGYVCEIGIYVLSKNKSCRPCVKIEAWHIGKSQQVTTYHYWWISFRKINDLSRSRADPKKDNADEHYPLIKNIWELLLVLVQVLLGTTM